MAARNRGPPIPAKGGPHGGLPPQPPVHDQPFPRGFRGVLHPALHEEVREAHYSLSGPGSGPGPLPRQLPPHPLIIEERLAAQHDDIQVLLVDNQRLAATHVALRQEVEAAQYELKQADNYVRSLFTEKDSQMRELFEKSVKMENEHIAVNAMKSELMQVSRDIKELTTSRQELSTQVQMMTQDLGIVNSDLQQIPSVKAEIEGLRIELERTRAAIDHEKKGFAESYDHGKVMENKLVAMTRELEKLRAELANAEKRAHVATAAVNHGGYNTNYGNPEAGYAPGNHPYSVGYGMMPTNSMQPPMSSGADGYSQYGDGGWGAYDMQRGQGPR